MSETDKKGSAWPWIAVPVAAVVVFFVLRHCQQQLPPAPDHTAPAPSATTPDAPSSPKPGEPAPAGEQPPVAPETAPSSETAPAPR